MNTLKSLFVMMISAFSMMIDVTSRGIIGWCDKTATNMLTSEHICVRCGNKNNGVSPKMIFCPECKMELDSEENECECDCEEHSHPSAPFDPLMYR